jgi:hypothetical protein
MGSGATYDMCPLTSCRATKLAIHQSRRHWSWLMRKLYAAVKGSMRTTARAPTALAKRWTVRMDGVPLPLSMRATTLWVVPMRAATSPCVRPAFVRAAISSRASSNSGACAS